jgi:hypothetical protein
MSVVSFRPNASLESTFAVGEVRAAFAEYWELKFKRAVPVTALRSALDPPVPVRTAIEFNNFAITRNAADIDAYLATLVQYLTDDGFIEGIFSVFPKCDYDLVTLARSRVRLFREGQYPPARGTYFCIEGEQHFLYTMGYIPYLETFPGSHIPEPWQILERHGSSAPKDLFREVLELTKMNVNNCSSADGTPITLSFSEKNRRDNEAYYRRGSEHTPNEV